jgi:S-adenosylmethionine hydrolase
LGSLITLTTDFGDADGYHAVLEGVIGGINREARIVTISNQIGLGEIIGGWYLLKTHHRYFPPGTIHLAIVDPGVGTSRKIITVKTALYQFVGPDNGLLSFIPEREIESIHSITNRKYALSTISPVFHGRDIMAPAAAYLSLGVDPACLGSSCKKIVRLTGIKPVRSGGKITGRIIWVDRFGNLISNIQADDRLTGKTISACGKSIGPIRKTFSDVKSGKPLAYIGSGGHLEIAVRNGSAADFFSSHSSDEIKIEVV